MNDLNMEKMNTLKEKSLDAHLNRLDQIEARLWDVIKQMEMT